MNQNDKQYVNEPVDTAAAIDVTNANPDVAFTKDKWPKQAEFLAKYTLAVEVDFADEKKLNDGNPVMTATIVERGTDAKQVIASARPMVMLKFGIDEGDGKPDDRQDALTFFGPDGTVLRVLSADEGNAEDSKVINTQVAEAWGLEPDGPLIHKIGEAMAATSVLVNAAGVLSQATGASASRIFGELSKNTFGDRIHTATKRKDGSIVDDDGNPARFDREVTNEG